MRRAISLIAAPALAIARLPRFSSSRPPPQAGQQRAGMALRTVMAMRVLTISISSSTNPTGMAA
jgi:hypothetical protein